MIYKRGVENSAADALSRHPAAPAQIMAISTSVPQWLTALVDSYAHHARSQELLQQLSLSGGTSGCYTFHQGVIRYKDKIWLGSSSELQLQVF